MARNRESLVNRDIGELNYEIMHGARARESDEGVRQRIYEVLPRHEYQRPNNGERAVGDRLRRSLYPIPAQDLELLAASNSILRGPDRHVNDGVRISGHRLDAVLVLARHDRRL